MKYSISSNVHDKKGVQGPQPQNSYAVVDTEFRSHNTGYRLDMYCCSNETNINFVFPNGVTTSDSYFIGRISKHRFGCLRFHFYDWPGNFQLISGYRGIYTCRSTDHQESNIDVNIGLYEEAFKSKSFPVV